MSTADEVGSTRLDGRVIVVSGATSGIGLAACELVVERGGTAVLLGRRKELLDEHTERLGDRAIGVAMDVADSVSVNSAFAEIAGRFPAAHALINAAGAMRYRRLEACSDEDLDAVVGTNLLGPMYTIRAALPLLRAADGADIVNLGSEVSELYLPCATVYTASKVGLAALSDRLGRELRKDGIRVTHVVVGYTETGLSALIPEEDRALAREAVVESAYGVFSGTHPMNPRWVADTALYPITRPRGQYVGVVHARSMS